MRSFSQAILVGKKHRNEPKKRKSAKKMHKTVPFCTDAGKTPICYTPVSVHPRFEIAPPENRSDLLFLKVWAPSTFSKRGSIYLIAHRNRSDVCDLRLRCPSRTPEIARFPRQEKAMLHCDLRVRWKVASDLRFRAAIPEPKTPSFCGISGDLAPSMRKSLAIAIVRFWCAKVYFYPWARGKFFYLQLECFFLQLSFFAYSPLRPLLDALSHCKHKSSNCK